MRGNSRPISAANWRWASRLRCCDTKADAAFVRAATGFAIGGVPPFGHPSPLQTLVDEDLLAYETIWAAAGAPNAVFSIAPKDLVAATGGTIAAVHARGR